MLGGTRKFCSDTAFGYFIIWMCIRFKKKNLYYDTYLE
jgi:hypothetical protein